MKLGIVGLPNVGKSTLFNAITNAGIPADNYAFCTIDPNVGVVAVPDEPGGLAKVLSLMACSSIDIEYMYSLIDRGAKDAYMVFRVSNEEKLLALLSDNGLHVVPPHALGLR